MNIGIVGGGSIGLLLSCYLSGKHNITIYVRRNEQKQKLNEDGVRLTDSSTPIKVKSFLIHDMAEEECVIVCVKQAHISSILPIINRKNKYTPIVFLQNGMEHIDKLHAMMQPIIIGVVEHGALQKGTNVVAHTGKGKMKLAAFQEGVEIADYMVTQLNQAYFPVELALNWQHALHGKLIINAVINPLTALFNVTNGEILKNAYLYKIAEELCYEASSVLDLDFTKQWNLVQTVAHTTRDNISSMLKDIRDEKQTEIEAITGYLIDKSADPVPYTDFMHKSIKALEVKKGIKE